MKGINELILNLGENWVERFDSFLKSGAHPQELDKTLRALRDLAVLIESRTKEKGDAALARALGLIPSSETKPRKKRRQRTSEENLQFHRERRNYHARKLRKAEKKSRTQRKKNEGKKTHSAEGEDPMTKSQGSPPPPDDSDDDDDFDEEAQAEATDEEFRQLTAALAQDAGDADNYPEWTFEVTNAPAMGNSTTTLFLPADRTGTSGAWRPATVETERYDFVLSVEKWICQREVLTDPVSGEHRTGAIEDVGPKGSKFTWNAIANLLLLIVGTAMPMHRIERLLGTMPFRRPAMVRILADFAWRFLPVYLHMARRLAGARILAGDDTGCRVNEVTRYKNERVRARHENPNEPAAVEKPWEKYREKCREKGSKSLGAELDVLFGLEFLRSGKTKRGEAPKPKGALQTTLLTGLDDPNDPRSRMAFYRTHFGSVGNLLDTILAWRDTKAAPELIFQGDLSPANHVSRTPPGLKISFAGCAAHARRFFKRFYHQDPDYCDAFLSCFSMMAYFEGELDDTGRNSANVRAVRNGIIRNYWEDAKRLAEGGLATWPSQTAIGKGIRYLLNGYEKLTKYLNEPHLPPDNNLCENLLRYESLEDSSSFGRATLEGRARFDVARSAMATCGLANVEPRIYITFVLMAEPHAIAAHPEHYTPRRLATWLACPEEKKTLLDPAANQACATALRAQRIILRTKP